MTEVVFNRRHGVSKIGTKSGSWTNIEGHKLKASKSSCASNLYVVVAKSAVQAEIDYLDGRFEEITAGVDIVITQLKNDHVNEVYAKCKAADESSKTLDNAAAVDKGTSPPTVGMPSTAHGFAKGDFVTIAGTTNYDGEYFIVSVTANEFVIASVYIAETFAGTETAVQGPHLKLVYTSE